MLSSDSVSPSKPPPLAALAPSTPNPTLSSALLQILRGVLYILGTLGVAIPAAASDPQIQVQVVGGVVLIGTAVWDVWQHFQAARRAHAGAVASAKLGRAVSVV